MAIHLAVGRKGQRFQEDEGARDHGIGEFFPEEGAQLPGTRRLAFAANHVSDEAAVTGGVLAGQHGTLAYPGMSTQGGLDLARLDAAAAHLHLPVCPTQELQQPTRLPSNHITCPVHPRS